MSAKRLDLCIGFITSPEGLLRKVDPEITGGRCFCGLFWEGPLMPYHDPAGKIIPEKIVKRYNKRRKEAGAIRMRRTQDKEEAKELQDKRRYGFIMQGKK